MSILSMATIPVMICFAIKSFRYINWLSINNCKKLTKNLNIEIFYLK
jgi:hypothetical protein